MLHDSGSSQAPSHICTYMRQISLLLKSQQHAFSNLGTVTQIENFSNMSSGFLKTYFHVMTQSYMDTINLLSLFFFGLTDISIQKTLVLRQLVINFKSSLLWRCKYDIYIYTHIHTLFFWNVWLYIYETTYISVVLGNVKQKFHWTKLDRPGKLFKLLQWGKEMEFNSAERKIRRVF